jgi:hypothetical protein
MSRISGYYNLEFSFGILVRFSNETIFVLKPPFFFGILGKISNKTNCTIGIFYYLNNI